jgi:hypothetical protein
MTFAKFRNGYLNALEKFIFVLFHIDTVSILALPAQSVKTLASAATHSSRRRETAADANLAGVTTD